MPSTPPRSSLLQSLNPYASLTHSTRRPDPDSPSTLLLRELSGDDPPSDTEDAQQRDRERLSPTPTPTFRRPSQYSTSSEEDEDGPPRSIIYGDDEAEGNTASAGAPSQLRRSGERTPRSPQASIHPQAHQPSQRPSHPSSILRPTSPGPFQPPSSSTSARSRSTSPGPSTMSVYASGLDGTGLNSSAPSSSREPSTSPEMTRQSTRLTPTFREPPRPGPPLRTLSSSSSKSKKRASPRLGTGQGYLDPSISSPSPNDRKGKGKAKNQGGRQYHALPSHEEQEEEDGPTLTGRLAGFGGFTRCGLRKTGLSEYEKALWRWVNVDDLDGFLQEVYEYYKGKGIYCIALARVLNLLTTFFVIAFSTFLLSCIDYSKLTSSISGPNSVGRLDDVLIGQCLTSNSLPNLLFTITVAAFYVFQLGNFALSLPRLMDMYRFYTYLLGVPDADIQTLPWPEIVRLIGEIRKHNPVTSLSNGQAGALADMVGEDVKGEPKKLDAHDVANRILRQENYLIALFNKDLLDLRVRLPVPHSLEGYVPASLLAPPASAALPSHNATTERKYISFGKNTLTKALEWNLRFCLMGYLFDRRGQVRKEFVREKRRKDLVEGLQRRFIFMGVLNAIFAPFIVIYLLMYSFFRYFEEYHKNPSSIGGRQYTPYAQWKFREFNELPHLFERRLDRSYPTAKEYIDQFPKERTALVMRFVAFVAGSFAAVLLVASLIDPDLFLHFEITPHRTVLFYLGVFGSVLAIARGMVPEENLVFDPDASLREVVRWTHYLPGEWRGKLHSQMVHAEFGNLFALKITIFFTELLSVLLTPFILFFSLPPCAGAIVDFFREFTVHVDGVGYVCSFAVFDFRRHGTLKPGERAVSPNIGTAANGHLLSPRNGPGPITNGHANSNAGGHGLGGVGGRDWRSNENKMEKSFLHFKATHPDWQPSDPASSIFLDRLVGIHQAQHQQPAPGRHPQYQQYGGVPSHLLSPKGGVVGAGSSIYAGGRGLGIGGEDMTLRERSRSYDRAWAKSSTLLRRGLENVKEGQEDSEEEEEGEEEVDGGWNRKVTLGSRADGKGKSKANGEEEENGDERDVYGREGDERDEEGFLRDVGMMGLLQQVMGGR